MNANEITIWSMSVDEVKALIETNRQQQAEIEALKAKLAIVEKPKRTRKSNEEDAMLLGAICRGSRAWLGWSQAELANKMDKCVTVVARIEQGISNPQYDTVNKLMSIFESNGIKILRDDKTFTIKIQEPTKK